MLGFGKTEAKWWEDCVLADSHLVDPFNKSDDSHNTWVRVGPITVWGGKIDWLLYASQFLQCDESFVSRGGVASDHPYLRVDLGARHKSEDAIHDLEGNGDGKDLAEESGEEEEQQHEDGPRRRHTGNASTNEQGEAEGLVVVGDVSGGG